MPRILTFTRGPDDWRGFLADPEKHWRTGYSARTLAHSWEAADGFPPEIERALTQANDPLLTGISPVFAVPEFKVSLPGGARASQNDIFVLAKSTAGPVAIMVEGKVNEAFGPTLDSWLTGASLGKRKRLEFLLSSLGLQAQPDGNVRYQLLHRAASAIVTAEQYRAAAAIVLVHSFSPQRVCFPDYAAFLRLFNVNAEEGVVQRIGSKSKVPLFAVWVVGDERFLKS